MDKNACFLTGAGQINCLELCLLSIDSAFFRCWINPNEDRSVTQFSLKEQLLCLDLCGGFIWSKDMLSAPGVKWHEYPQDIALTQTLPSFNPSFHLTKHTSYSHSARPRNPCRHLPAISAMPPGWASSNVISVTITMRGMWFIMWINFNSLQEDTKSVCTFMSYSSEIQQVVQVLWRLCLAPS